MASIPLDDRDERFISEQLKSGRYSDAGEVVRAGLRMLESFEHARETWLEDEIPRRFGELQVNPDSGAQLDAAFERLEARHRARMANDK